MGVAEPLAPVDDVGVGVGDGVAVGVTVGVGPHPSQNSKLSPLPQPVAASATTKSVVPSRTRTRMAAGYRNGFREGQGEIPRRERVCAHPTPRVDTMGSTR